MLIKVQTDFTVLLAGTAAVSIQAGVGHPPVLGDQRERGLRQVVWGALDQAQRDLEGSVEGDQLPQTVVMAAGAGVIRVECLVAMRMAAAAAGAGEGPIILPRGPLLTLTREDRLQNYLGV